MYKLREKVWKELVEIGPRPPELTDKRLAKAKDDLADDEDFWQDIIQRHGADKTPIAEMDEQCRDHLIGNFWGQVHSAWMRQRNKKDETC